MERASLSPFPSLLILVPHFCLCALPKTQKKDCPLTFIACSVLSAIEEAAAPTNLTQSMSPFFQPQSRKMSSRSVCGQAVLVCMIWKLFAHSQSWALAVFFLYSKGHFSFLKFTFTFTSQEWLKFKRFRGDYIYNLHSFHVIKRCQILASHRQMKSF